jgi:hypothetical protein
VTGDAPPQGVPVFRSDSDSEIMETLRLDGAYRFTDELQAGIGVPLIRRARQTPSDSASSTGLGDLSFDFGYECLPELSYSVWKPKGFVFFQATLPTSPSVYDANEPFLVDARGRGFFSLSIGSAFVKTYGNWDFLASFEGHRSFSRSYRLSDGGSLDLTPGYGASALLGAGLSPGGSALRVGLSISPVYEAAIRSSNSVSNSANSPEDSVSDSQLVWNTSLQVGYAITTEWSTSFTYTDQTLLGPAKNVSLSRTVAIATQKRWEL